MMERQQMRRFLALALLGLLTSGMIFGEYTAKELNRRGNESDYKSKTSFSETLKILKRQQGAELDDDPLKEPWLQVEVVKKEDQVSENDAPSTLPKLEDLSPEEEAEAMGRYKTEVRHVKFQPVKALKDRLKGLLSEDKKEKEVPSKSLALPGKEEKKDKEEAAEKTWKETKAEKARQAKERILKEQEARKKAEEERLTREKADAAAKVVAKAKADAAKKHTAEKALKLKKAKADAEKKRKVEKALKLKEAKADAEKKRKVEEALKLKKAKADAAKKRKAEEAQKRKRAKKKVEAAKRRVLEEMKKRKEAEAKKSASNIKKAELNNKVSKAPTESASVKQSERAKKIAEIRKRVEAERAARLKREGSGSTASKNPGYKGGMEPANPDKVRRYKKSGEKEKVPFLKRILRLDSLKKAPSKKTPPKKEPKAEAAEPSSSKGDGHLLDRLLDRFKRQQDKELKGDVKEVEGVEEKKTSGKRRNLEKEDSTSPIRRLVF